MQVSPRHNFSKNGSIASPPKNLGGRPTIEQSAQLTDRIVEIATSLFLQTGFEATSLDSIANATNISKRTLYARFSSKSELFESVVVRFVEERAEKLELITVSPGTVRERLEKLGSEILRVATDDLAIALDRLVTGEVQRFPELGRVVYDKGRTRVVALIKKTLDKARVDREIDEIDTSLAAEHFVDAVAIGPMRGVVMGVDTRRLTPTRLKKLRFSVDLFLRGIGARSGSSRQPAPRKRKIGDGRS